jgi:hypothetical protein
MQAFGRVYKACKQLFAALPLAALVGRATLVLHGGLFRRPAPRGAARAGAARGGQGGQLPRKRKRNAPVRLPSGAPSIGSLLVRRSAPYAVLVLCGYHIGQCEACWRLMHEIPSLKSAMRPQQTHRSIFGTSPLGSSM